MLSWGFSELHGDWLEWDEHDPQLHGQIIMFTEPMVIIEVNSAKRYGARDFKFKYRLATREDAVIDSRYEPEIPPIELKQDMQFTIVKSLGFRDKWWKPGSDKEGRMAILLDEENREVIMNSFGFFRQSSQPELAKLQFWGETVWKW